MFCTLYCMFCCLMCGLAKWSITIFSRSMAKRTAWTRSVSETVTMLSTCCSKSGKVSLPGAIVRAPSAIVAGTCWEYGAASGPVTEDRAPVDPCVFAATKLELLESVREVAGQHGFDYRWARLFFVYGPGQRAASLIPSLRTSYLAGEAPEVREPGAVQDFIHVVDAAEGLVALAAVDTASGIFNVGTGRPTSVAAVANQVADSYAKARPFDDAGEGRGFWADTSRS